MRNVVRSRTTAVAVGVMLLIGLGGVTSASAHGPNHGWADSHRIKNDSVRSVDVRDGTLGMRDLSEVTKSKINERGPRGPQGEPGVSNLEADGPYPGATDLGDIPDQGDNSDDLVPPDSARHTVWVQCPPGKTALGGGFRVAADASQAAAEAIHVIASEPTQVENGGIVVQPIQGDPVQSIRPNGWLVEVVNNGTTDQVVRPWVICADVN